MVYDWAYMIYRSSNTVYRRFISLLEIQLFFHFKPSNTKRVFDWLSQLDCSRMSSLVVSIIAPPPKSLKTWMNFKLSAGHFKENSRNNRQMRPDIWPSQSWTECWPSSKTDLISVLYKFTAVSKWPQGATGSDIPRNLGQEFGHKFYGVIQMRKLVFIRILTSDKSRIEQFRIF